MSNKKKIDKTYSTSVKPYYYPAQQQCYILYSRDNKLSEESKFNQVGPTETKELFGFNLLCDDLVKSTTQTYNYISTNNATLDFSYSLGKQEYTPIPNILDFLVLHPISLKMEFGVSTNSALPKGRIIAEYIGERKNSYIKIADGIYVPLKITDKTYVALTNDGKDIDAKDYGNVARFFNHCPSIHDNPNVLTANLELLVQPASKTLEKLYLVTIRDIKEFEPLCWDYGSKYNFAESPALLDKETYLPINDSADTLGTSDNIFEDL